MLQRNRSVSLPKLAGDIIFQSESDFHSDVYDDTEDSIKPTSFMTAPPVVSSRTHLNPFYTTLKLLLTMVTGSSSSIFYMMLLREDSSTALLAAFVLHLCVIVASLPNASKHMMSPKIPYHRHGIIVLLSYGFVYLKSFAVQMLPMQIILVMSNMQLVLGLFVGKFLFGKKFSVGQHVAVVLISLGCTLQTWPSIEASDASTGVDSKTILVGMAFMLASLLSISIMIPFGSKMVQQYDANVQEQMFMQHFLAMPLFYLQYDKIATAVQNVYNNDAYFEYAGVAVPVVLLLLVATSSLGQINRNLSMELSLDIGAMSSQLVNTLHKTISLFVSMLFFNTSSVTLTAVEILRSTSYLVWLGLLSQTIGSIWYVQASYSEDPKSTFRASKSVHRLSRVSFSGETKLGLSNDDIKRLRAIAQSHREKKSVPITSSLSPAPSGQRKRRAATAGATVSMLSQECADKKIN